MKISYNINASVHTLTLYLYPFLINLCGTEHSKFMSNKVNGIAAEVLVRGVGSSPASLAVTMGDK